MALVAPGQLRMLEHAATGLRVTGAIDPLQPRFDLLRRRSAGVDRLAEHAGYELLVCLLRGRELLLLCRRELHLNECPQCFL
ncbi:MAG: hypothetical protein U0792_11420 [Gemmataceae bacterium]